MLRSFASGRGSGQHACLELWQCKFKSSGDWEASYESMSFDSTRWRRHVLKN